KTTLQSVAVLSAVALLCNRTVRASALVLGSCLLVGVVSSKAYYGNNKTFVGLSLVLIGLSDFDTKPYLFRWQFSLVYFGAALNKLLDPDWQSGLFFDYWATAKVKNAVYLNLAPWLPELVLGKIMCWGTITAEFAVSLALFVPRLVPLALGLNVLFQVGLLEFTGNTFTLFFYAMNAATLAFVVWPERLRIEYDPGRGGILRTVLRLFDPDGLQHWLPSAETRYLTLLHGGRAYLGIAAVRRLLFYSPVFWLGATVLLAQMPSPFGRRVLVAAALALALVPFGLAGLVRRHKPEAPTLFS